MKNQKTLLSTLWIFITFNYLYCDLIGLMDSKLLKQYLNGSVEGFTIDGDFLLYAGILMEIPISMILLSRILSPKPNAVANILAGVIKTLVMILTLLVGSFTKYYLFFACIEIATTIFIIIYAFKWFQEIQRSQKMIAL
ncbi:hypothetical protein AD998_10660 [bacterium 336/3]|nr:hypothetical protein AD998_10660 [bacterium 336/3]